MTYIANFPNFWVTNFKGELAALSAAFLWAIASVVWSKVGQRIGPLELNFLKGAIAIVFLGVTIFLSEQSLPAIDPLAFWLLLLSGAIGIAIADTALFAALNSLGARRTLLLKILTSPLVALIALVFLQETLSVAAWCGIFLTLLGVAWVVSERVPGTNGKEAYFWQGILWALVSTCGDAIAAILSRVALTQTTINPLWSTLIRLTAGLILLLIWILIKNQKIRGNPIQQYKPLLTMKLWIIIAFTSFIGTYLGIWLQQISLKFAPAGIAQTLNATSPLFVLPIAIWLGEKVSFRAIAGVLLALVGITLLFRF
ncbi:DMT family transporter [Phormidium sp. LEGE 05292]|uniref:DMT family transporter n=1 Tax=[Phormidium] sp. LEGE 05292 TaxID=767427 RepID=UPI0018822943|nr:DMT family transporter [Phormidium sp. LEGE 05292]MBE9226584.1 DMT family transporter [Phormidium sp. LEGE 05292]